MDMSIIILAILLFVPVYLIGIVSNNKVLTLILAAGLILLVMVYAGEKYMYFDIMGIGIAIFFAFQKIDK